MLETKHIPVLSRCSKACRTGQRRLVRGDQTYPAALGGARFGLVAAFPLFIAALAREIVVGLVVGCCLWWPVFIGVPLFFLAFSRYARLEMKPGVCIRKDSINPLFGARNDFEVYWASINAFRSRKDGRQRNATNMGASPASAGN